MGDRSTEPPIETKRAIEKEAKEGPIAPIETYYEYLDFVEDSIGKEPRRFIPNENNRLWQAEGDPYLYPAASLNEAITRANLPYSRKMKEKLKHGMEYDRGLIIFNKHHYNYISYNINNDPLLIGVIRELRTTTEMRMQEEKRRALSSAESESNCSNSSSDDDEKNKTRITCPNTPGTEKTTKHE
ncbi:Oidioi.mRNA.OKI2018_I69.PAR.g12703.t1.cds [Oikopleura dioica]|uniref:Oidioi.mRNA.OKI2018_I69.PAR.g12703.t1.cds n=1 Tax=Oikopleura dioica TaxID=34765 RepID=A0ABN7S192_OIKDI|nr:Oidioi.mRNA.OKI2018_I69.PAR.g12703.t1.cds [Oikopleura dioica]